MNKKKHLKKSNIKELEHKQHLLQNNQNADTTLLHSHDKLYFQVGHEGPRRIQRQMLGGINTISLYFFKNFQEADMLI